MLSLPEGKAKSDIILEKIEELTSSMSELRGMHSSPGAVTCPGCKALINLDDFPGHYADNHPKVIEKIVEKPVEKIVETPAPMTPNTLPAVFDHILKCEQGKCEWVQQFKTDEAKKSLEKMGYVERGKEGAKSEAGQEGPEPLI